MKGLRKQAGWSAVGIIVGALVALVVFLVGTAITSFVNEGLVWGIVAILVWLAIAARGDLDGRL